MAVSLQQEELLANAFSEYSCLYDKTAKGHKEKVLVNAWNSPVGLPGECTPQALVVYLTLILPRTGDLAFSLPSLILSSIYALEEVKEFLPQKVSSIISKFIGSQHQVVLIYSLSGNWNAIKFTAASEFNALK